MRTRRLRSSSDPVSTPRTSSRGGNAGAAKSAGHQTVLLHEAIDSLSIIKSDVVVDATVGGAGHSSALTEKLSAKGTFIGIDADSAALARAKAAFAGKYGPAIHLVNGNFRNLDEHLRALNIDSIDKALFDLGWSGYQLTAQRGFSFQYEEPLLMTYEDELKPDTLTAREIVNEWEETSIADILWGWGGERYARRIAGAIVKRRIEKPFETSKELADVIASAVPSVYRHGKLHPATKTFQALRIAVNDEIGALEEGIRSAWKHLHKGGRIAVITFHSIEDRAVKRLFLSLEQSGEGTRVNKSPTRPQRAECVENPRSRSAKLRVIEKIQPHQPTHENSTNNHISALT